MKKIYILTFLLSFLLFVSNTNASCTYSRTADLKRLASNVNVTYNYNIVDNTATFDIKFANLTSDIYVYDSYNDKKYNQSGEIIISKVQDGTKYRFFIKSNDSNCKDEVLLTKYVTLPKYNKFYGDPLCEGIESYALCQRWGSFNINNYEDYVYQIKKYKASLEKNNKPIIEEEEQSFLEKVGKFLLKYYVFILLGIIVVCSLIIYILRKKDKFNF